MLMSTTKTPRTDQFIIEKFGENSTMFTSSLADWARTLELELEITIKLAVTEEEIP